MENGEKRRSRRNEEGMEGGWERGEGRGERERGEGRWERVE
jgi:hypothetical protein